MSLLISAAAIRTYDALKRRPGAHPRKSDARDAGVLEAVHGRLNELISTYRLGAHKEKNGRTYVFWTEINALIGSGAFDDLLDRL